MRRCTPVAELDPTQWEGVARSTRTEYLGRECVYLESSSDSTVVVQREPELADGFVELDLAVGPERSFPGVAWRVHDIESYESFFVRPHQVGNPDAIQYTPVWHGVSAWQLYHGDGYWAPGRFPSARGSGSASPGPVTARRWTSPASTCSRRP